MTPETLESRLAEPSRVVRIGIERSDAGLLISLSLVPIDSSRVIELRFVGASDVQFLGERTELSEIVLLLAEDITSRGWEGLNFRVRDYENEFLSFVCREIKGQ